MRAVDDRMTPRVPAVRCADPWHAVTTVAMRSKVLVAVVMSIALPACCQREHKAGPSDSIESAEPVPAPAPSRCSMVGKETIVGERSANANPDDDLLPFASEVGQATAFDGGFAVGVLHPQGGGTNHSVVTISLDGSASRVLALGASHGDAEPPRVFGQGASVGVAVLEPTGASRTLRIARVDADDVHWASELRQGVDESMAFDVVLGNERGIVVWDDVPKDRKVSGVYLSTFDAETFERPTQARVVTLPGVDADSPRVVRRPGGFWLFWLVRRLQDADYDAVYRAEDIAYRWLEVVPLDESGAVAGTPRRIGSDLGHVLAYDVVAASDGGALVAWRDDDTPSGSTGGQILTAMVRQGGIDGPDPVDDASTAVGAPTLMTGWFAIADATGPTRIAPIGADGKLADVLRGEDLFGMGEPLASRGDLMLVARPSGQAMRIFVARCTRDTLDAGTDLDAAAAP